MRALNRALSQEKRMALSAVLMQAVERDASFASAHCIAAYCALPDEPETRAALSRWAASGRRIVVPRVEGDRMQFYDWSPTEQCAGAFGIDEPTAAARLCPAAAIDLMLVPGVAFTRNGERLGRGKGYYDRYLAQADFRARTIGIGYPHQLLETLPTEPHDRRLDAVAASEQTA